MTTELITPELVDLDLAGTDRRAVVRSLAERLAAAGRVTDVERFLADIEAREQQMPTGLEGGIGIPHCRSAAVTAPTLAFGRSATGVDFGAEDGPADLIFLIAAPEGGGADHMTVLAALARRLVRAEFKQNLRDATDAAQLAEYVRGEVSPLKYVAVTACPTGIAHTYMAAEALEQAAKDAGHEMLVETQGSAGSTPLSTADIEAADAVILAADVGVRDRDRFAGKPVVEAPVKQAINDAAGLLLRAADAAAQQPAATPEPAAAEPELASKVVAGTGFGTRLRQWLMTGVSYMIPFVAAGGLLIALSFALGGYQITEAPPVTEHFDAASLVSWAALFNQVGSTAFEFLVPVLAGFIAFAIADRPAIAPGFVGGAVAVTVGAGFLGGLIAGLLAGAVLVALKKIRVPRGIAGIMPVVVLPLLGTLIVGLLMFVVIGKPIALVMTALTGWLTGLSGANAALLGALLGAMIAFDMGGPINKVAYTFAVGGLSIATTASLEIMAAVMAAGMVPPLALALASAVRGKLFTPAERASGRTAWLLGASFITEGAIPFAAGDPLRVIPSIVVGSATTGALSMAFGATLRAPHGGIFVLPLVGNALPYLGAIAAGVVVAALAVLFAKQIGRTETAAPEKTAVAA